MMNNAKKQTNNSYFLIFRVYISLFGFNLIFFTHHYRHTCVQPIYGRFAHLDVADIFCIIKYNCYPGSIVLPW